LHDYFGTQVAYYFVFNQFICQVAGILCVVTAIYGIADGIVCIVEWWWKTSLSWEDLPFIGGRASAREIVGFLHRWMVCIAGLVIVECWARIQRMCKATWDLNHVDEARIEESLHPSFDWFDGEKARRRDNLKEWTRRPKKWKRWRGKLAAHLVTLLFAVSTLILHIVLRGRIKSILNQWQRLQSFLALFEHQSSRRSNADRVFDLQLTVQIKIVRAIWQTLAPWITTWERHKYQTNYDESLECRVTLVFYVNVLVPFLYVAFYLPWKKQCPPSAPGALGLEICNEGCLDSLQWSFCPLILAEFGVIVVKVACFMAKSQINSWTTRKESKASFLEHQVGLRVYDGLTLSYDYQQLTVVLCYTLLFSGINWGCTCIGFLLIVSSQRLLVLWKVLRFYRRPMPGGASVRFGKTRQNFLRFMAYASAAANWGLICFYSPRFSCEPASTQGLYALLVVWPLVGIYYSIQLVDQCLPTQRRLVNARHKYQHQQYHKFPSRPSEAPKEHLWPEEKEKPEKLIEKHEFWETEPYKEEEIASIHFQVGGWTITNLTNYFDSSKIPSRRASLSKWRRVWNPEPESNADRDVDDIEETTDIRQGCRITAKQDLQTDDYSAELIKKDQVGVVQLMDDDGDALVEFEGIAERKWINQCNFHRFGVQHGDENGQGTGSVCTWTTQDY
jgi:hypothetical protein